MNTLLIATTNPGKLGEIRTFLADVPIKLVSLSDLGITDYPVEHGATLEENAILKAKHYAALSGLPAIADDGGFEIDALGGEPGVKSHRWISRDRDDEDDALIAYAIARMKHVPPAKRGAQLRLVLALALPSGKVHTAEDRVRGVIPAEPSKHRTPGFPYRSLLFLPELGKFYDHNELTSEENKQYNHRKRAIEKLKPILREKLTGI